LTSTDALTLKDSANAAVKTANVGERLIVPFYRAETTPSRKMCCSLGLDVHGSVLRG